MKKIIGIFSIFLISLIVAQGVAAAPIQDRGPRPVDLISPRANRPLVDFIRNGLVSMIFGMEDAGFPDGDVLLAEFTTQDDLLRLVPPSISNRSTSFNVIEFKNKLDDFLASNDTNDLANTTFLQNLKTELENVSTVEISHFKQTFTSKRVNTKARFVVMLWDNDKSVINAINQIQNNESLSEQPFTGDEILNVVQLTKTTEKFFGSFREATSWTYDDGSSAVLFKRLINMLGQNPDHARRLIHALNLNEEVHTLRSFIGFEDSELNFTEAQARLNTRLGFSTSQLQIKTLELTRAQNNNIRISKLEYIYVEHQSMGLTIFNDTNNNNIMDMGMKTIQSRHDGLNGTVIPTNSDEALYRVDFQGAGDSVYTPVSYTGSDLTFGLSMSDVHVNLNPVDRDRDSTIFSDDYAVGGEQTIDNAGFIFHFYPNETSGKAIIKFDYELGEWSDKTVLDGLSLNHMMVTSIQNFEATSKTLHLQTNETDVETDGDAKHSRKMLFQAGQAPIADVELDNIPYEWAGTSDETAYGQTLPLLYGEFMFGSITQEAEILHALRAQGSTSTYLYSVSYPKFSGESIVHDPTYSMLKAVTEDGSDISSSTDAIPGFEFVVLLVIPGIVILRKTKKEL